METKVEETPTLVDTAKLVLAAGLVVAGLFGYYYFGESSQLLRTVIVLIAIAGAALVGLQSLQGQWLWKFIQAARVELRKVVWPTREETIQTTIAVLVFAVIMGVFFWLLDLFLLYVTSKITGQGGL
jgi:preprotein translocase subunit SecE